MSFPRQVFINQITAYKQKHDSVYKFWKNKGKKRADNYLDELKETTDDRLEKKILKDYILTEKHHSSLGSSKELRELLGRVLCTHYQITEEEITAKSQEVDNDLLQPLNPQHQNLRHEAISRLLFEKTAYKSFKEFLTPLKDSIYSVIDSFSDEVPNISAKDAYQLKNYRRAIEKIPDEKLASQLLIDFIFKKSALDFNIMFREQIGKELCIHWGISVQRINDKLLSNAIAMRTSLFTPSNPEYVTTQHEAMSSLLFDETKKNFKQLQSSEGTKTVVPQTFQARSLSLTIN